MYEPPKTLPRILELRGEQVIELKTEHGLRMILAKDISLPSHAIHLNESPKVHIQGIGCIEHTYDEIASIIFEADKPPDPPRPLKRWELTGSSKTKVVDADRCVLRDGMIQFYDLPTSENYMGTLILVVSDTEWSCVELCLPNEEH